MAMKMLFATTCAAVFVAGAALAQQNSALSDEDYMKRVMKAAPSAVVENATIVRMQSGDMKTLKKGSNEWTCMDPGEEARGEAGDPMCMDKNAGEWAHAYTTHGPAPDKTGFIYMLAGDTGASNTDPYAKQKTADNHWVQTGSHVMIVGPAAAKLGYPRNADPDPTAPYVMWPGSPYEHVMIPVK
jgi:hypothetical protein